MSMAMLFGFLFLVLGRVISVMTSNGLVLGTRSRTEPKGNTYYAFRGIRYAEPVKRFRLPVPVKNWTGIYNATYDHAICVQIIPTFRNESEDCLFLSVYTPMETTPSNAQNYTPTDYDDYYYKFDSAHNFNGDFIIQDDFRIEHTPKSYRAYKSRHYTSKKRKRIHNNKKSRKSKKVKTNSGKDKTAKKLPVMVWIHGGAFITGDSSYETYGPDYLLDENVLVIQLNYRLGAFGFLTTGDGRIPANLGVKDIIIALQWIKKNVQYFGGDPDNITLFGQSAGAVLITYIIQSPLTRGKGYFHRTLIQSGNNLCSWSFQREPKKVYDNMVIGTGCIIWSMLGAKSVLHCLRTTNTNILKFASAAVFGLNAGFQIDVLNGLSFSVVLEEPGDNAAITEGAYSFYKNQNVPNISMIVGVNSEESVSLTTYVNYLKPLFLQLDLNPSLLIPVDLYANYQDVKLHIAQKLVEFYYNNTSLSQTSTENILRFVSGIFFNRPFRELLTLIGNKTKTFCYKLSYSGQLGGPHQYQEGLESVGHTDDLNYLFKNSYSKGTDFPKHDYIVRQRILKMWTNFAKTGNPTPVRDPLLNNITWSEASLGGTNVNCIDIRSELGMIKNPYEEEYQMWRSIYNAYGNPKDTY